MDRADMDRRYWKAVDTMEARWAPYVDALKREGLDASCAQTGGMIFCLCVNLPDGGYAYLSAGGYGGLTDSPSDLEARDEWGMSRYDADGEWLEDADEFSSGIFGGDSADELATWAREQFAGIAAPPNVTLRIDSSVFAFDTRGEILEVADVAPNVGVVLPHVWRDEAGVCDERGSGGGDGFRRLHDALTAAESTAALSGVRIQRVAD